MIDIHDLTVALGNRPVLKNLSLFVDENEILALSGESGSGKSTLLRTLIGQHRPQQGRVVIDGVSLDASNLAEIRPKIFYLPQDLHPLGDETARDFLQFPFQLAVNRKRRFDEGIAETLFARFGLKLHLMESKLRDLSGGERKRLGLVQALLLKRPILLLDELTSSVDEHNSDKLVDAVINLSNTTVLAITHDSRFMARASRHVALREGRIDREEEESHGSR